MSASTNLCQQKRDYYDEMHFQHILGRSPWALARQRSSIFPPRNCCIVRNVSSLMTSSFTRRKQVVLSCSVHTCTLHNVLATDCTSDSYLSRWWLRKPPGWPPVLLRQRRLRRRPGQRRTASPASYSASIRTWSISCSVSGASLSVIQEIIWQLFLVYLQCLLNILDAEHWPLSTDTAIFRASEISREDRIFC